MINIYTNIYNCLSNNAELIAIIQDKIFPLVIEENTLNPAVVIERSFNEDSDSNKDLDIYSHPITITIVSDTYDEAIDIAMLIDESMKSIEDTDDDIIDCFLTSGNEYYTSDGYYQQLIYSIKA